MNCKQGDLAIVRLPTSVASCSLSGLLVTVVCLIDKPMASPDAPVRFDPESGPSALWLVRVGSLLTKTATRTDGTTFPYQTHYVSMWDHRLRPIRDPGDDARDETLEWKSVPAIKPEDVWPFPPKKEKA